MTVEDQELFVEKVDNVNHPKHYKGTQSVECFDVMGLIFGTHYMFYYCIINAFKYLWRCMDKNGVEDLDKAEWYLNKAHDIMKSEDFDSKTYFKIVDMHKKLREEMSNE